MIVGILHVLYSDLKGTATQAASVATPRWPKNPRHPRGHRKIKIPLVMIPAGMIPSMGANGVALRNTVYNLVMRRTSPLVNRILNMSLACPMSLHVACLG